MSFFISVLLTPTICFHSFSITHKKKGKDPVDVEAVGVNNSRLNGSYREMADSDLGVIGDFDPCSNIV